MKTFSFRKAGLALAAAAGLATAALSGGVAQAAYRLTSGEIRPFATAAPGGRHYETYGGISGRAVMERDDDSTWVSVEIDGLVPGVEYPVHVHNRPCAVNYAGDHYKQNTKGPSRPPNEIWPGPVTADRDGSAVGETTVPYVARASARSVVVHAPNGDRLACADLG